jgi:uroporphyrinogen-III synthase
VKLAAVGGATATALSEIACRDVDFVPRVQRVEGMVAEFPPGAGAVLVAQGDLAGPALADGLRTLGYTVTAVEAYTTTARRPAGGEVAWLRSADVVVVASGSAATALADATPIGARLVAIGPSTAAAASAIGLPPVTTAVSPSDDDVVGAIAQSLG